MALHKWRGHKEGQPVNDIYSALEMQRPAERYRFPETEGDADTICQLVHDELMIDGNARLNLATFCTTYSDPHIKCIMNECLSKNMIDKDEYPQMAELEMRCVHMLADLWNAPESRTAMGCSTTGSSEAAMLGGLAMKRRWEARRKKEGKSIAKPNIVTGPVQVCWHKFARYWDVELREIPMEDGMYISTPERVTAHCDENTIGVVQTLGTTFTLEYEPVAKTARALDEYQAMSGLDIPIHVDGASGGFLAPFVTPHLVWDFRLERVKSINASGHKFGLAPLGAGWVLWRTVEDLPEELIFYVNYLGGNMPTFALNFSRPGGQIAAQYYCFLHHGREGYTAIQKACYDAAHYFACKLRKFGIFDIISEAKDDYGVPGVCWKLQKDARVNFNLYDLADRLRTRGWQVPAYALPSNCQETVIQRILVRHGVSKDLLDWLLYDMENAIRYFQKNPVQQHSDEHESGGFRH